MAQRVQSNQQVTTSYGGLRYNGELTLSTDKRPAIKIREYANSPGGRTIGRIVYESHIDAPDLADLIHMLQLMQADLELEKDLSGEA